MSTRTFRWTLSCVLLCAVHAATGWCQQFPGQEEARNVIDAAAEVTPRIANVICREQSKQNRVLQVAVLPFGDANGKVGQNLFFAAKGLQGEITSQLRNHAERKFIVWDVNQLKQRVQESGADVSKLTVRGFQGAGDELKKIGADAAVVGSYQTTDDEFYGQAINVHADVLFTSGAPLQVSTKVEEMDPAGDMVNGRISTRFSVDILVDGQELPLYAESEMGGKLFLELDQERHYGKEFTIRIRNHGLPPVGWLARTESSERGRFYSAAVFVDGVNSIYQLEADGKYHPSQRHPRKVTKWAIAGPGLYILPNYDSERRVRGYTRRASGYAGAEVLVKGFQLSGESVARFEFGDAGESLANEVGLTKDIGVISVYFYAEDFSTDVFYPGPGIAMSAPGGVKKGRVVPQKVSRVTIHTHVAPVEVWHIFYRYKGQDDSLAARSQSSGKIVPLERVEQKAKEMIREAERNMGNPFRQYEQIKRAMEGRFPGPNVGSPGPF